MNGCSDKRQRLKDLLQAVRYSDFPVDADLAEREIMELALPSAGTSIVDAEPPQPSLYGRKREETLRLAREVLGCAIPDGEARQGILWAKRFAAELLNVAPQASPLTGQPDRVQDGTQGTDRPAGAALPSTGEEQAARTYKDFWDRHAKGSMLCPSCLLCGHQRPREQWSITHGELPDIYICKPCVDAARRPALPDAGTSVDLMAALKAKLPQGAPVAWRWKRKKGKQWHYSDTPWNDLDASEEQEPLYLAPAVVNAALEQEAERVIRMASTMTTREEHFKTKEAAKALLGEK
jgi:hypothetical protein